MLDYDKSRLTSPSGHPEHAAGSSSPLEDPERLPINQGFPLSFALNIYSLLISKYHINLLLFEDIDRYRLLSFQR